jgi:tetratricopeptide (TPR) repeat protein
VGEVELERPDLDDIDEEASSFRRLVAVAVVLITLFGSIVAYVQAVESNKEDVAARNAQRDAIVGMRDQVAASARLTTDLRLSALVDGLRLQRDLAARRIDDVTGDGSTRVAALDRARLAEVAEAIEARTPIRSRDASTFGDTEGLLFERPDAARLEQAVEADRANQHGDKADSYVAVLTVLAVALFLLGLSLTVQGRNRFALVVPGAAIAVACVAWAGLISTRDVTTVSQRAIDEVAEGTRLASAGEFDAAIESLDDAVEESPGFAAAFARRAEVTFQAGSQQIGQSAFLSITSDEALEDALDDIDRALALGADDDVNTVALAGFLAFLDGDFERSVDLSQQALDLNDRLAPIWFNLGVANVALGDEDEARDAYREGLDVLEDVDDSTSALVLAAARTDLSILRDLLDDDELDDVSDLATATETRLALAGLDAVQCTTDGVDLHDCVPASGDVEIGEVEFVQEGGTLDATATVTGLDDGEAVAATWYVRTADDLPFEQTPTSLTGAEVVDGTLFSSTVMSGALPCPVAGEYLVRYFTEDGLVGEATTTVEPNLYGEEFTLDTRAVEGMDVCLPAGFEVTEQPISPNDPDNVFIQIANTATGEVIALNVFNGSAIAGIDPGQAARTLVEASVDGDLEDVTMYGRSRNGGFVRLPGLMAVGTDPTGAPGAAAVSVGTDQGVRTVLLSGPDVSRERLLDLIHLITFTGVGIAPT